MKLTDLGKQKDKAKESYESEQLKREKLSGNEKILEIKQKDATEDAKKLVSLSLYPASSRSDTCTDPSL